MIEPLGRRAEAVGVVLVGVAARRGAVCRRAARLLVSRTVWAVFAGSGDRGGPAAAAWADFRGRCRCSDRLRERS